MIKRPLLSVVMPVHNGLPFLDASIASIVNQTLPEFELIILDDCSTDETATVLGEWEKRDPRVRIISSNRKLGLSGSSNAVVSYAKAPVVARMDADDISHPYRLRRQFEVIESRPDVVAVGTLCEGIDAAGKITRPRDRWRLVRRSQYIPFPHGSAMFRRVAFDAIGGYREFVAGEDQDFFHRLRAAGRVVTLPDVLYYYRYHLENATLQTKVKAVQAVAENGERNGQDLAALYLLGAMRLWAGQPPNVFSKMIQTKALDWNLPSLVALTSAMVGTISPKTLRLLLRSFIGVRDRLAGLRVQDGKAYEWRLK